jgi:ribonuclease BN (tRNA processing enzyme)
MKITFLGTNGWYDTLDGNTISTLIETDKFNLIFDAGNGFYRLSKYINFKKPAYLFISHLHIDHIEGLHTLNKLKEKFDLTIYCFEGYIDKLKSFLDSPFTAPLKDLTVQVKLCSFKEGEYKIPFNFVVKKLLHADNSFGFRINLDGKILSYCCDTAVGKGDIELSKEADLLIHECSLFEKPESNGWGHSSPKEVAEMAKEQRVKKLALTHFDASVYTSMEKRKKAEKIAKKIFPNSFTAKDNLQIII